MKGGDNLLNKEDLGILIEKKRTEKKLTQKELALKIGVVNTAIYKYEKGLIKNIPLENRIKLAYSLGIDSELIFSDYELENYFTKFINNGIEFINPTEKAFLSTEQYHKFIKELLNDYNDERSKELDNALHYIDRYLRDIMCNKPLDYFDKCMVLNLEELSSLKDCCYILDNKYILIDYSRISEEDKERVIGITSKYDKPKLFNENN